MHMWHIHVLKDCFLQQLIEQIPLRHKFGNKTEYELGVDTMSTETTVV
jgi:hypothetical protein